jgi:hypothetical protein
LLIRLGLCIDPHLQATSGITAIALRSLGLDSGELSQEERTRRDKMRARIRAELVPSANAAELPGMMPGLGPTPDERPGQSVIFIPWAAFSIIAEKIARGCEYRYKDKRRLVEHPYGIRTFIEDSDVVPEPFASHGKLLDFGPGCKVKRVFVDEDPNIVRYWISIWGTLHFTVLIDLESYLQSIEKTFRRPDGTLPPVNVAMQIPEYLGALTSKCGKRGQFSVSRPSPLS